MDVTQRFLKIEFNTHLIMGFIGERENPLKTTHVKGRVQYMSTLRKKLIRLAYENPSLQKDLLPLLTENKPFDSFRVKKAAGDEVIETRNGVVIFSAWAKDHILKGHTKPGKGSVFERKSLGLISKVIPKLRITPSQSAYDTSASGVGYDLVWPTKKILSNYPDAIKTTAQKDEGRDSITVDAYQVKAPIQSFKTNRLSIIIRPTTDAKFIPKPLQKKPEVMNALQEGNLYAVLSAWPGRSDNIPRASQWGGKYAVIIPS